MIFQHSEIKKAVDILKCGGLVAFPTETVYGLGASVFLPEAVQKIFQVKGRPKDNPLIVHISDLKQLPLIVKETPEDFDLLARAFFPGPLTILLPKQDAVPSIVSANLPTIGVRMPAHPLAREFIDLCGVPLVAPSANLSGKPSSTTADHVYEDFGEEIDAILDGGSCEYGIESTVLALTPTPQILRPGAISQEQLEQVLNRPIQFADEHQEKPLSPGMKYRHYSPQAKVHVFYSKQSLAAHVSATPSRRRAIVNSIQSNTLYALFRQADTEGQEEILIFCDESTKKNKALMNRIIRASY